MKVQLFLALASVSLLFTSSATGCGSGESAGPELQNITQDSLAADTESDDSFGGSVRIAWFGNTPDNTYDNASLNGAIAGARRGHSTVRPFYCQYDPQTQLDQCLSAVRSRSFDAFLIDANDGVGIIPCVQSAASRGISVVAVDLPIGSDPASIQPQVRGQDGAVLTPAAKFGDTLVTVVSDLCGRLGKCNLVYLAGSLGINYDIIAIQGLQGLLPTHQNIQIVSIQEALYDQATARTIMQGILAQTHDIQVVIAGGDQMARGAEEALAAAGPLPNPVKIIGGGAGAYAVDAVRAGRWYGTFVTLPFDEGELAAQLAIRAARRQRLKVRGIDPVVNRNLPAFLTADNLAAFSQFTPQWPG